MFAMYLSLTKGQGQAFKQFISDEGNSLIISEIFLKSQLKCFYLYRCIHEAEDDVYCKIIESSKSFDEK